MRKFLLFITLLLLVGCNTNEKNEVDIRGTISNFEWVEEDISAAYFFVEGDGSSDTNFENAAVYVLDSTIIENSEDKSIEELFIDNTKVEVIFTEEKFEGNPAEGLAYKIKIIN